MLHRFEIGDRVRVRRKGLVGHVVSWTISTMYGKRPKIRYRIGITVVMGDDPTGLGLNRQTWEISVPANQLARA